MSRITHLRILLLTLTLLPLSTWAQKDLYNSYINQYMSMAVEQMVRYRVPASITMAQALLESRAGTSLLAVSGKNHFGIKCGSSWCGPYMLVDDDAKNEHFRVYQSVKDSYEDHSKFLCVNGRYANLFTLKITDYKGWAYGLKAAGYATNPKYADILIQLIEDYDLSKLDHLSDSRRWQKVLREEENPEGHKVMMCNENFYTIARQGDTFKSISKEMGVSERRLRKYNEVDRHYVLQEGDIIYFQKKQKRADKAYRGVYHRIKDGESLYTLSQHYGMRLKTLYSINKLSPDYLPKVDDLILLRK
ncbi:MAG: glucosaminidase domain-containing protein [Bacteroidaceae bacterium]|nr:glucosaminidase domain-containing protein [Bacteroidaceae bacterium]